MLIAFVIGIVLNLTGAPAMLPELQTYATHFSGIVTPVSMVILGMKLAGVPISRLFASRRMYYVSAMRLVLYPAAAVAIMSALNMRPALPLDADAVIAFFMALAMPTAGLASTFSDQHHGDTENAVIFTLGTTMLSIITIPALYSLLQMVL